MRIVCLRALCVSAALLLSAECAAGLSETKVSSRDVADLEKGPSRRLRLAEGADENNGDERMFNPSRAEEIVVKVAEELGAIEKSHHLPMSPPTVMKKVEPFVSKEFGSNLAKGLRAKKSHRALPPSSPAHDVTPQRPSTSAESVSAPSSRKNTLLPPKDDVSEHAGVHGLVPDSRKTFEKDIEAFEKEFLRRVKEDEVGTWNGIRDAHTRTRNKKSP